MLNVLHKNKIQNQNLYKELCSVFASMPIQEYIKYIDAEQDVSELSDGC